MHAIALQDAEVYKVQHLSLNNWPNRSLFDKITKLFIGK